MKTNNDFERRSHDGSPHTFIPAGTTVEVEEITDDFYEVTAESSITKNNSHHICVSGSELKKFVDV